MPKSLENNSRGSQPDLQAFRDEWKKELMSKNSSTTTTSTSSSTSKKRAADDHDNDKVQQLDDHDQHSNHSSDEPDTYGVVSRPPGPEVYTESEAPFPFQCADSLMRGWQDKSPYEKEASKRGMRVEVQHQESSPALKRQRHSLVEVFIQDLNELDGLPFFDMELPREIALKIFEYLDMQSLCHCAMVSQAWRSLADEDNLWEKVYHKLSKEFSFETVIEKTEDTSWKQVVQRSVTESRTVRMNWKEHRCHVTYYHHARGGILTKSHSLGDHVVAGYTSGQVKVWNILTNETQTFESCDKSLVLLEEETEVLGTSQNSVSCIKLGSRGDLLTGYSHGHLQLWNLDDASKRKAVSYPGYRVKDVTLSNDSMLGYVQLAHTSNKSCLIKVLDLSTESLTDIDTQVLREVNGTGSLPDVLFTELPHTDLQTQHNLLYLGRCNIYMHTTEPHWNSHRTLVTTIEEFCATHFTCLEASLRHLCVGLVSHLGVQAEYKVKCYDPGTLKHCFDLRSHTSQVTCIDSSYPTGFLLGTGCHDRRVRVFDSRLPVSSIRTFMGHTGAVQCIQLDDWKIISGDSEGYVCVWDQRRCAKLWETQSRHPVKYLHFNSKHLIAANIPYSKTFEDVDSDHMTHLRYRGRLQVCDFSTSQQLSTVPSICSSNYDMPDASTYNLALITPYDQI